MLAFATEIHVERGGAVGRALRYCLQAAAELGRFFEREDRQKNDSSASSKPFRAEREADSRAHRVFRWKE